MNSHTVLLFGPLRDKFDSAKISIEMPNNCSLEDVLDKIGVDGNLVKTAVDGEIVPVSTLLPDPCEIAILPPVSGG